MFTIAGVDPKTIPEKKTSEDLPSFQKSTMNDKPQASSSGSIESLNIPKTELMSLLQRYEEARHTTDLKKQFDPTLAIAKYYYNTKNFKKALRYYNRLNELCRQVEGSRRTTEKKIFVKHMIGVCLIEMGEYKQSLQWLEKIILLSRVRITSHYLANQHTNYAMSLYKTEQYDKALEQYKMSLKIQNHLTSRDTESKARTLWEIGNLYNNIYPCDYTESLAHFIQALAMYRNIHATRHYHDDVARCLYSIGQTHSLKNQLRFFPKQEIYLKSRTFYTEALAQYKEIHRSEPYHADIDAVTSQLGRVCLEMRDYESAEDYYRKLTLIRELRYGRNSQHDRLSEAVRGLLTALKGQNNEKLVR